MGTVGSDSAGRGGATTTMREPNPYATMTDADTSGALPSALVLRAFDGATVTCAPLPSEGSVTVGRSASADVVVDADVITPEHLRLASSRAVEPAAELTLESVRPLGAVLDELEKRYVRDVLALCLHNQTGPPTCWRSPAASWSGSSRSTASRGPARGERGGRRTTTRRAAPHLWLAGGTLAQGAACRPILPRAPEPPPRPIAPTSQPVEFSGGHR